MTLNRAAEDVCIKAAHCFTWVTAYFPTSSAPGLQAGTYRPTSYHTCRDSSILRELPTCTGPPDPSYSCLPLNQRQILPEWPPHKLCMLTVYKTCLLPVLGGERNFLGTIALSAWKCIGMDPRENVLCVFISAAWQVRVAFWQNWETWPLLQSPNAGVKAPKGSRREARKATRAMPALSREGPRSGCLPGSACKAVPWPVTTLPWWGGTCHLSCVQWKRMRWEDLTESAPVISEDADSVTLLRLFHCCLQPAYHCADRHFDPKWNCNKFGMWACLFQWA